jgi:hypothetical protein
MIHDLNCALFIVSVIPIIYIDISAERRVHNSVHNSCNILEYILEYLNIAFLRCQQSLGPIYNGKNQLHGDVTTVRGTWVFCYSYLVQPRSGI